MMPGAVGVVDTKEITGELGVLYVLKRSVRRSGNKVRANADLIDAETDAHLGHAPPRRFTGTRDPQPDSVPPKSPCVSIPCLYTAPW
jgi:hypothetical protein